MMADAAAGVLPHAGRKFYDIPSAVQLDESPQDEGMLEGRSALESNSAVDHGTSTSTEMPLSNPGSAEEESDRCRNPLFDYIENNIIGKDKVFSGPYGLRKVEYCDYIASGRSLKFLEDYIQEEVLPEYGNTHTTTTVTSLQTTLFRHEARDIVRNSVGASEHDAVIFTGSGCTGAVHKLIQALRLSQPPVVFVGPYEHHSNLLPWHELGSHVVQINETVEGLVDIADLRQQLQRWAGSDRQLIGCFAAASNITGILVDVDTITVILHQHGALAFWDYATAAPYVRISMNPVMPGEGQGLVYKDAVFMSPHKFVGGVQTPGILVAKKSLFRNPVPSGCGGGSVFFVRREAHRYLQEAEMREEGGTPAIVESIRAGLVFQLKESVTPEAILEREHQLYREAVHAWQEVDNLVILGNTDVERLPIFSFLIRHPQTGLFLHHNFICTILNDVFGIQARGGCACAGPYAQELLGIDEELAAKIENLIAEDSRLDRVHLRRYREFSEREILRPGFARLNLAYFMKDESIQFVLEAVKLVARHGWKLLPQYTFNPETGEWRHRNHQVFRDRKWLGHISYKKLQFIHLRHYTFNPETGEWRHRNHQVFRDRKWLGHISYKTGQMTHRDPPCPVKAPLPHGYQECLARAVEIFEQANKVHVYIGNQTKLFDEQSEEIRWFLLPSEALHWMKEPSIMHSIPTHPSPFQPIKYPRQMPPQNQEWEPVKFDTVILPGMTLPVGQNGSSDNQAIRNQTPPETVDKTQTSVQSSESHNKSNNQPERTNDNNLSVNEVAENTNSEKFREGLVDSLSAGFSEVSLDSSELNRPLIDTGPAEDAGHVDAAVASSSNSEEMDANRQEELDNLPKNVNSVAVVTSDAVSEEPAAVEVKTGDTGESSGEKAICENGLCFVKRPASSTTTAPTSTAKRHHWHSPPKVIFKPFVEAMEEFSMVCDGDRVLVCLSGGKDSLSLLHTMHQYQFYAKKKGIQFELGAVTVDPMTSAYDPSPLKGYLAQLNVPYFYEEQSILEAAANLPYECTSICSFCSRMKRGRLYAAARRNNYNILAMGQHLDDLAESFLMSVFHNGILRTMKANYTVMEGDLRIIRPFVYVREENLRRFAEEKMLPVIPENCPACFEAPKERHRMKQLLAAQEVMFPKLFHSLQSAIQPIMAINRTGVNVKSLFTGANRVEEDDET